MTRFNAEPEVSITSHNDGDQVSEGVITTLRGAASDPDDESEDLYVTWYIGGTIACEGDPVDPQGVTTCVTPIGIDQGQIDVEVKDAGNAVGSARVLVEMLPSGAPVVLLRSPSDGTHYYVDTLVPFDATITDSEDEPDAIVVEWESSLQGALDVSVTPDSSGLLQDFVYLEEGEHVLTVSAEDSSGKRTAETIVIDVGPPNSAPECGWVSPEDGGLGQFGTEIVLTGQVSDADVDASILTVEWRSDVDGDLGSSSPESSGAVILPTTELSATQHVLTMKVTDDAGASCSDVITFSVGGIPDLVFDTPSSGDTVNDGDAVSFVGTVSDPEDAPEDLTFSWSSDIDGEFSTRRATADGRVELDYSNLSLGDHVLTIVARDTDGFEGAVELDISVNAIPSAPEVALAPDPARTDDDLSVTIVAPGVDPEGDTISYDYAWYLNGFASSASSSSTLSASSTAKGELWRVDVTASDAFGSSDVASASVTIQNTPPEIATVAASPDPASVDDTLTCTAGTTTDADGDSVSVSTRWTVGTQNITWVGNTIGSYYYDRGDDVTCYMTPNDGAASGSEVTSNTVTIGNAPPSVSSVSISPDPVQAGDTLTCAWSGYSDSDGDADQSTAAWALNGTATASGTSWSGGAFVRGDTVTCTVSPYDGSDTGTDVDETLTVENTAPTVSTVSISPTSASVGDTLTCSYSGYSDVDGDSDNSSMSWTINGTSAGSGTTLSSGFVRGDSVACNVTPNDGYDSGTVVSGTLTVSNTAPTVSGVSLSPTTLYTDDWLVVTASSSDADGDTVRLTYAWYVDGAKLSASGASLNGALYFDKSEDVYVTVTPTDGYTAGSAVASSTVTVLNSAPEAPVVQIDPEEPEPGAELLCEIATASVDADGDTVTYTASWDVDGVTYAVGGAVDTADTGAGWTGSSTTTWTDDTIPGDDTAIADEVWTCTMTPNDGTVDGDPGEASAIVTEPFSFDSTQTIDGATVTCGSTTTTSTYTQCNDLEAGGMAMPNGVSCSGAWRATSADKSDTQGFCESLTGSDTFEAYYGCATSETRATWNSNVWSTVTDNGYTAHVRCYYP